MTRWVPDPSDRAWVARCLADEGPAHHRGSTLALLTLLDRLVARLPAVGAGDADPKVKVPLRLPPHLTEGIDPQDQHFPVTMPTAALRALTESERELDAMIDCLTDGPPHHALANALMVAMITEALRRAEATG